MSGSGIALTARPIESSVDQGEDGHRVYTSIYEVITPTKVGPITVGTASGLPAYQAAYSWLGDTDPLALRTRAISAKVREIQKSALVWRVIATHSTKSKGCAEAEDLDPLSQPHKVSGSFAEFTRFAVDDREGNPLLNSSDEPFLPPVEVPDSDLTLIVEFNSMTLDLPTWAGVRNCCNSTDMFNLPARTVKLKRWNWSLEYYQQCYAYFKNTVEFAIKAALWNTVLMDQGYRRKLAAGQDGKARYELLCDEHDQPLSQPRLLNGDGDLLPDGEDAYYYDWEVLEETDLSVIGVPDPLW